MNIMDIATQIVMDEMPGSSVESETHRLVGWGSFDEIGEHYVLPRVFDHLVRLATPVVQEYHSDLYRDAQFLNQFVKGPSEMDYVVYQSGTHLGLTGEKWNMAGAYINAPSMWTEGAKAYRIVLFTDDRQEWFLKITPVPLVKENER